MGLKAHGHPRATSCILILQQFIPYSGNRTFPAVCCLNQVCLCAFARWRSAWKMLHFNANLGLWLESRRHVCLLVALAKPTQILLQSSKHGSSTNMGWTPAFHLDFCVHQSGAITSTSTSPLIQAEGSLRMQSIIVLCQLSFLGVWTWWPPPVYCWQIGCHQHRVLWAQTGKGENLKLLMSFRCGFPGTGNVLDICVLEHKTECR